MRRWSRKAVAWATGATVLLLLGLWREDVQVAAVGMVMALFLLLAYLRRAPHVVVSRRPSNLRVLEEDLFEMTLNVGSEGAWADCVEVHDHLPGYTLMDEGTNHMTLPMFKDEVRRPSYSLLCPLRGSYRVGPIDVRASDAPGLFYDERTAVDIYELDVAPLYVELRSLDLVSRALKYNMGPVTVNELGRSTDFYSIREYIKGDPYRKINWKASAKRRKLMINEDEKETLSDCALFIDSRALAGTGTPLENFHETSLRAALGVSRTLVANKNRVMVVTYNDAVNIVPPGLGSAHNGVVQAMLTETVSRGALTFDWAAEYARPFFKPRIDIVVFSPLVSDMSFYGAVLSLIRMGHRVVVVTAALEEYERRAIGEEGSRALLMGLQRSTNAAELESAGVSVLEVEPDEEQLSILVRLAAALGGERLEVSALDEGLGEPGEAEGEAVEEFEADEAADEVAMERARRFRAELFGFRIDQPHLALLQVAALVALMAAAMLSYGVNDTIWDAVNSWRPGELVTLGSYAVLVATGVLLAWALSMMLGYLRVELETSQRTYLVYLAYLGVLLIVLWHLGYMLFNLDRPEGEKAFVSDIILISPLVGALAIFRRVAWGAMFAAGVLVILGLVQVNPMEDLAVPLLMAAALVVYLELTWAVQRYDDLYELAGRRATEERGLGHLRQTMVRYGVVTSILLTAASMATALMFNLPKWYVAVASANARVPVEGGSIYGVFLLFMWFCVFAVLVRWMVLTAWDTPWGARMVRRVRERLVLHRGDEDVERPPTKGPEDDAFWEPETPQPEVPLPAGGGP